MDKPELLVVDDEESIRSLRSTTERLESHTLVFEHVHIDHGTRQVWVDGRPVYLTQTEFNLLSTLAQHKGLVLSREQLLEKVWGNHYYGEVRVIDVNLARLRQKLGRKDLVVTIRRAGYRFEDNRQA